MYHGIFGHVDGIVVCSSERWHQQFYDNQGSTNWCWTTLIATVAVRETQKTRKTMKNQQAEEGWWIMLALSSSSLGIWIVCFAFLCFSSLFPFQLLLFSLSCDFLLFGCSFCSFGRRNERTQVPNPSRSIQVNKYWLVVSTPLKNISQLGWLFPVYEKI